MSGLIAKYVGKKIFKELPKNSFGCEDPYFEQVPVKRMSGRDDPTKTKKRKKALPPGLTPQEENVLIKVKRRAYRLDMSLFNMCGLQFGISSLIAFIPVIGDFADALLAMMVVRTAQQADLPQTVLIQMLFNVLVDFLIGLVPFVGDLADVAFKANTRNAALLEQHLRERGRKALEKQGLTNVHDPSLVDVNYHHAGDYNNTGRQPDVERGEGGFSEQVRGDREERRERHGDREERRERREDRRERRERREDRREDRAADPARPVKAARHASYGTRQPGGHS
ncbi:hypothetical protein BJ508DRAFT_413689 [Ascobolus immersus RN42]|uniref:PH domain-containing protein n=1 Tax=Ascobolus immersus RN42 TaxID=1160509 RepID=A0A3N4IAB8_ASCIM|nr:hypothetical protein BJ508DRAFT_413689 [Ascobolus immersus RN42]